jgi:hypothetical protein
VRQADAGLWRNAEQIRTDAPLTLTRALGGLGQAGDGDTQDRGEYKAYDAKGGEQDTLPPIEVRALGIIEELREFLVDLDPWQEQGWRQSTKAKAVLCASRPPGGLVWFLGGESIQAIGPRRMVTQDGRVKIDGNPRHFAVAPDGDVAGWRSRLKELFGTASPLFVEASLRQLIEASKLPSEGVGTTTSLSAALELIASLEPENEAQAALAVHVACLHTASLSVLSRTHRYDCDGDRLRKT